MAHQESAVHYAFLQKKEFVGKASINTKSESYQWVGEINNIYGESRWYFELKSKVQNPVVLGNRPSKKAWSAQGLKGTNKRRDSRTDWQMVEHDEPTMHFSFAYV